MSINISGFGSIATIQASSTLPIPYPITQFADDKPPYEVLPLQVGDVAMGNNGDLLKWKKANAIKININVAPSGIDDDTLSVLLENNRVGKGKLFASTNDTITLCITQPNGLFNIYSGGVILEGQPGNTFESSGRLQTKTYSFAFENRTGI
jgi:hypothetical protein